MPENVGKYQQGDSKEPNYEIVRESGMPGFTKPSGRTPRGEQHDREKAAPTTGNTIRR